jgi:hypothetical protein
MAQRYDKLNDEQQAFIKQQQLFFVGTAASEGRINVSPKGGDTLRLLSANQLVWLNLTGSGNETSAHLQQCSRMTMMFCSFTAKPLILRLYGEANIIHPRDAAWQKHSELFPNYINSRQFIEFNFDLVQTSCGFGVPFYEHIGDRENMDKWVASKGEQGIKDYWKQKNQISLDGLPTNIVESD